MEHWFWLAGFALLSLIDLAAWRRRDARLRWPWSLWSTPSCGVLYGLWWGLEVLAPSGTALAAFLGMFV